jgi:uroporphyrinogen-III synthase
LRGGWWSSPAIERGPVGARALDGSLRRIAAGEFDWVVFTSRSGVEALLGRLPALGLTVEAVKARVAAVGEGTARALRERGVEPALVPRTFTTDALSRAMPSGSGKVLLARADVAPDGLEAALARKGWTALRVDAYRTRPADSLPPGADRALREGRVDAVTFTSASTVQGFAGVASEALKAAPRRPKIVCIGPVTARAARAFGLTVDAVARPHTIDGVVAALERVLAVRTAPRRATPGART